MERNPAQRNLQQEIENKRKRRAEILRKKLEQVKGRSSELKSTTKQELQEIKGSLPREVMTEVVRETGVQDQLNQVASEAQDLLTTFESDSNELVESEDLAPQVELQTLDSTQEVEDTEDSFDIQERENEETYIEKLSVKLRTKISEKAAKEFTERYDSDKTSAHFVLNQIEDYSRNNNAEYQELPEAESVKNFDSETKEKVMLIVRGQIDQLFYSSDKKFGRYSKEKRESVIKVTNRYADLIIQSQIEGGKQVNSGAVLRKLQEIVAVLAYQDEVASESLLGDHGVRHLVDHNIKISEDLFNQLEKQGVRVSARDRLMMHEVMIYHDLGYATDPVRDGVNKGDFTADKGHNVLASKIVRERRHIKGDVNSEIFSDEEHEQIHHGILLHDSNEINISFEDTPEARRGNFESFIHIADNTHAFEDKLPEVLYSIPETLKTMYLMRIASEAGDEASVGLLKEQLVEEINQSQNLTDADKKGLTKAARSIEPSSFKFSVGRICGNRPEVTIDESGKVKISVTESEIHRETVGVFDMKAYSQLEKFIEDLTGSRESINGDADIDTPKILFEIRKAKGGGEKTDYQQNIETLIQDKAFQTFRLRMSEFLDEINFNSDEVKRLKKEALEIGEESQTDEDKIRLEEIKKEILSYEEIIKYRKLSVKKELKDYLENE